MGRNIQISVILEKFMVSFSTSNLKNTSHAKKYLTYKAYNDTPMTTFFISFHLSFKIDTKVKPVVYFQHTSLKKKRQIKKR